MNHRIGRLIFGIGAGLVIAFLAFRWIEDPEPRIERQRQEAAVTAARQSLIAKLDIGQIEIVDPLAPDRQVGKTYVYRAQDGWEVSGYYRRGPSDPWHPFLATLDNSLVLSHLKISDSALLDRGSGDGLLEVLP